MSSNVIAEIAFFGFLAFYLYSIVKNRGFRGAQFGAPIKESMGRFEISRFFTFSRFFSKNKVEVYTLEGPPGGDRPQIGLWFSNSGSSDAIPLSKTNARQLVALLQSAIDQTDKDH